MPSPTEPPAATPAPPVEQQPEAGPTLIQLVDPLDEPEFYCVDVPGFGASLNLQAPLMAHTCKPGADDELFLINHPRPGNLFMPAYDLCIEADSTDALGQLHLKECTDAATQRFEIDDEGALRVTGAALCVSTSPEGGEPTGGPSHLRRDLLLVDCGAAEPALAQWKTPGRSPN